MEETGPQQKELRGRRDYFLDLRHSYYDYCDRCKVNLPMDRSVGHCDICDACIDGLDHHCPWVVRDAPAPAPAPPSSPLSLRLI